MRRVLTLLVTTALIGAPGAYAQSNNQYNSGDTTAVTDVEVGWAHDAGATAIASGNAVTTTQDDGDDSNLTNAQHMDGDTTAIADVTVWTASGNVAATTAAVSNGGTAVVTNSSSTITSEQLAHGEATATTTFTGASSTNAAVAASASNNTGAASVQNGELRLLTNQESTGAVTASASADTGVVSDQAVSGVIASANNLSVGGETATILTAMRQTATGPSVSARSDLYVGQVTDASGNATANANSVTIDNQWGYVNAEIEQNATANVAAESYVTLDQDFTGFASSGAYGVGNQANVSNMGSDTVMDVTQSNGGDVSAGAALDAGSGGMALASSAAYGNSISGSLCVSCDATGAVPSLTASSSQINDGDVYSSSVIRSTGAVNVGATSTAIGNAATYQVRPPGG